MWGCLLQVPPRANPLLLDITKTLKHRSTANASNQRGVRTAPVTPVFGSSPWWAEGLKRRRKVCGAAGGAARRALTALSRRCDHVSVPSRGMKADSQVTVFLRLAGPCRYLQSNGISTLNGASIKLYELSISEQFEGPFVVNSSLLILAS